MNAADKILLSLQTLALVMLSGIALLFLWILYELIKEGIKCHINKQKP